MAAISANGEKGCKKVVLVAVHVSVNEIMLHKWTNNDCLYTSICKKRLKYCCHSWERPYNTLVEVTLRDYINRSTKNNFFKVVTIRLLWMTK